jgi:hypothetical protein
MEHYDISRCLMEWWKQGGFQTQKSADENHLHQHNIVHVLLKLAGGSSHMQLGWLC